MEGLKQVPCEICKNGGHSPSHCPELSNPLKDGFYSGGGGGGSGHSHDDEEDVSMQLTHFYNRSIWNTLSCKGLNPIMMSYNSNRF